MIDAKVHSTPLVHGQIQDGRHQPEVCQSLRQNRNDIDSVVPTTIVTITTKMSMARAHYFQAITFSNAVDDGSARVMQRKVRAMCRAG